MRFSFADAWRPLLLKLILPSNVMRNNPYIFFRNISSISAQVNRFSCINPGPPNICNISNVPMVTGGIPASPQPGLKKHKRVPHTRPSIDTKQACTTSALRLINPLLELFYDLFLLLRAAYPFEDVLVREDCFHVTLRETPGLYTVRVEPQNDRGVHRVSRCE